MGKRWWDWAWAGGTELLVRAKRCRAFCTVHADGEDSTSTVDGEGGTGTFDQAAV